VYQLLPACAANAEARYHSPMTYRACALFFTTSALALSLAGCECGGATLMPNTTCTTNAECHGGLLCIDGHCHAQPDMGPLAHDAAPPVDAHVRNIVSLMVMPAMAMLTSTDGSQPTQTFTAQFVYDDGSMGPASGATWVIDSRAIGDVDTAGNFTANGVVGGTATLTASAPGPHGALMATGTAHVQIVRNVLATGVPPTIATMFSGATPMMDATREAGVVYPLDHAVMPQNVYPADIQWTRGNVGDLVRIVMTKTDVTTNAYVLDDANHHWLADAAAWRSIAQTDPMEAAVIHVDRIDTASGNLIVGTPVHVTFARAALTGSVYYWSIAEGRIVRIDDGTANRVAFMPNPEQGCVGCHSVSPSGRYMANRYGGGDNVGTVVDLTTDLTGNPPASLFPTSLGDHWWFSTWSPDETRLLVAANTPVLRLYNPMTGAQVAAPTLNNVTGTYPTWSHDGHHVAFVTNQTGWGDNVTAGDVALLDVTGPDAFSAPHTIHQGATLAGGPSDNYPSWSPDDSVLAFGHGTGSRSESMQSQLFIMAPDGSGVTQLAAMASGTDDFQPHFSPFTQGGYFWLSFLSRRIYGNPAIGNSTSPASPSRRQQIWVTAFRMGAAPGQDPSSVPYWLPGQDPHSANIAAYWAPRACRMDGAACDVGSECCGGLCAPDATGHDVCTPPPPAMCHHDGQTCSTTADCCNTPMMMLACVSNVCVNPVM
jgi:hypothetical protein